MLCVCVRVGGEPSGCVFPQPRTVLSYEDVEWDSRGSDFGWGTGGGSGDEVGKVLPVEEEEKRGPLEKCRVQPFLGASPQS